MAITGTFSYCGLTLPGSYVRLEYLGGDKYQGWRGQGAVYKDETTAQTPVEGGMPPRALTYVNVNAAFEDAPEPNPYSVLYAALKALPEFENFTDV